MPDPPPTPRVQAHAIRPALGWMLPTIPGPERLWLPFRALVWIVLSVMITSAVPDLIVELWFLDSLGQGSVFVTNFRFLGPSK